jgi:hypothetical protein
MNKKIFLILLICLVQGFLSAQTKTNLEIFYNLVDSSVFKASEQMYTSAQSELIIPVSYSIFKNAVMNSFSKKKISWVDKKVPPPVYSEITYTLEDAKVKYSEPFRESFLGSFYIEREIILKVNWIINNHNDSNTSTYSGKFQEGSIDTINIDEIKMVENQVYDFTKGEVPAEPFFSSLLEPVIAIGTAAIVVYLFFSVRSK